MASSVSIEAVAASEESAASRPPQNIEIIELLDSDDEETPKAGLKVDASATSFRNSHVIDLTTPLNAAASSASRQTPPNHQPEIIDLLDAKPAARTAFDGDLDRKKSTKKRPRHSGTDSANMSDEIQFLDSIDIFEDTVPPAAAAVPDILEISEPKEPSPLMKVLEVLPDVALDHVKKLLKEHDGNPETVVSLLLMDEKYPKQKSENEGTNGATATPGSAFVRRSSSVVVERQSQAPKYDYSSLNSFEASAEYMEEAVQQLLYDFSFLKTDAIRFIFKEHHMKYTLARQHVHDTIVGNVERLASRLKVAPSRDKIQKKNKTKKAPKSDVDEDEEKKHYHALQPTFIRGTIPESVKERIGEALCVSKPRKKVGLARPNIKNDILQDEVLHFEKDFKEWMDTVERRMHREAARKRSLKKGSTISCQCCYEDVAESECVPCKEYGHMFCSECIQQYVESQVFGSGSLGIDRRTKKPATEILCCSGDCTSGFKDIFLKSVLRAKTWEKYCELQHIAVIEQAGLGEEMSSCSKCGFRAHVPESQILFECPVKDCLFVSCKKCGKEPHIPLRCEEVVQQTRQDEGRLTIEEALSDAKMRTCPECKQKFIKESGCNKMVCRCGLKLCYVCRKPLTGNNPYAHFCQTPHCEHKNCGKCQLHSNTEEDDAQAMREAGISAAEMYKAKIKKEDGNEKAADDINLDVDRIMHDPAARTYQNLPQVQRAALPLQQAEALAVQEPVRQRAAARVARQLIATREQARFQAQEAARQRHQAAQEATRQRHQAAQEATRRRHQAAQEATRQRHQVAQEEIRQRHQAVQEAARQRNV